MRRRDEVGGSATIVLGITLLVVGYLLGIGILWTLGIILIVVGVILVLLGAIGRPVLGRRHWEPTIPPLRHSTTKSREKKSLGSKTSFDDALDQKQFVQSEYLLKAATSRPHSKPVTNQLRNDVISGTAVFISYRRAETSLHAELIYKELVALLGTDAVFKDVDSLRPGEEFRQIILDKIRSCRIVLVLIGSTWTSITDKRGRRRLDDPNDPVRIEIETALRYNVTIIPVLCDGTFMPSTDELPAGIVKLLDRQAYKMSAATFTYQAQQLAQFVKGRLA